MKVFLIMCFSIINIGCNISTSSSSHSPGNDSSIIGDKIRSSEQGYGSTISENQIHQKQIDKKPSSLKRLDSLLSQVSIPFGNPQLIEQLFPEKWVFGGEITYEVLGSEWDKTDSIKYTSVYQKLTNYQRWADFYKKRKDVPVNNQLSVSLERILNRSTVYYNPGLLYSIPDSMFPASLLQAIPVISLPPKGKFYIYGLSISLTNSSNYIDLRPAFITVDSNLQVIDILISYVSYYSVYQFDAPVYIDSNYIFHIKEFMNDEGVYVYQQRYEKWQIDPQGRFVRFYRKNGFFENAEESGMVKDHKRVGKWIERKPNAFVNKYFSEVYTYLEASYKEGIPIDTFKYFLLNYDFDKNGPIVSGDESKGPLLYTETYENGNLIERKFIKAPTH